MTPSRTTIELELSLRWLLVFPVGALAFLVVVTAASASSVGAGALSPPVGLKMFQVRLGDASGKAFRGTPSFAWAPVRSAVRYQFQLATNTTFGTTSGLIWSDSSLTGPTAAVPISLPWTAGRPLYWRVRAYGSDSASQWSKVGSFQVQSSEVPRRQPGGDGYVRWSQVRGASDYQILFVNLNKQVTTPTTVADLRDYFADDAPAEAIWRVRAEHRSIGSDSRSLSPTSYGPWSPTYTTPVAPNSRALLRTKPGGAATVRPLPHEQMPVFLFPAGAPTDYRHLYIATDKACKQVVFNSPVVRGGTFAPRSAQVEADSRNALAANDGKVFTKAGKRIEPSEPGRVSLSSGTYFWTSVPVEHRANGSYHDLEAVPAECQKHHGSLVRTAAKPDVALGRVGFATGLSSRGRVSSLASAHGSLYGSPLVAWKPAAGATRYEVQWSASKTPWQTAGSVKTPSTSAILPLRPGAWWYRVRGLDTAVLGTQPTSWSGPIELHIAKPTFSIVGT